MSGAKETVRGDTTRQALIEAAVTVFARDGYHAASSRALANAANVNQALINYHFKGKEGLYIAVFEFITNQIQNEILPTKEKIQACLNQNDWQKMSFQKRKNLLLPLLWEISSEFLKLLTSEKTSEWAQLIVREQQKPTIAFESVYATFFDPVISVFTGMIKILRDTNEEESVMIALSILGQMVIWRFGRTGVLRKMNWTTIGKNELRCIEKVVHRNITAVISA